MSEDEKSLEGWVPAITDAASLAEVVEHAFDYRGDVTLDLDGVVEPATGRLISLPATGRPALNDLVLLQGRLPERGRADEVVAGEAFAEANALASGDTIAATLNGRRRTLTVVGIGMSPEYVYTIGPGALLPDNRRFGVFWMAREPLAAAFDLEDAFNDVSLGFLRGTSLPQVVEALDRLLEPYGGIGAVGRADQTSNGYLGGEIEQL